MSRLALAIVFAFTLLTIPSAALAKEGATTTFDSLPTSWQAGQTYHLGYTIRMDGIEPYRADRTAIVASSLDGKTDLVFPGTAEGAPGHYTATVLFPDAGTYRWQVTQGSYFPAFDLGTISVLPASGATSSSAATTAATDPLLGAVPLLALIATLGAALVLTRSRRRMLRPA